MNTTWGRTRAWALFVVLSAGCVPYTLGTTAQTVPKGKITLSTTVSNAFKADGRLGPRLIGGDLDGNVFGFDNEVRFGTSNQSDVGIRLVHATGLIATYKRRLLGEAGYNQPALSIMVGGGVLSVGEYLSAEAAILASGREGRWGLPYAAVRTLATVPGTSDSRWDPPIVGAHLGWRARLKFVPWEAIWLVPEVAAYHDRATTPTGRDLVLIPSLTLSFGSRNFDR